MKKDTAGSFKVFFVKLIKQMITIILNFTYKKARFYTGFLFADD